MHASTLKSLQKTTVFASLGLQIMVQTMVFASLEVQVAIETMMLVTKIVVLICIYCISGSTNVISHGNSQMCTVVLDVLPCFFLRYGSRIVLL